MKKEDVRLEVLARPNGRRMMWRWRVFSLILLHVLIIVHVVHWQVAGRTLGSVQLSNAMYTLELGRVNPAIILFGLALLVTLLAGRFFCGWACHMGGFQDLCRWTMTKLGVRPRPFRTRLLPFLPVAIGLYMFVWPTFKREVAAPLLSSWWPSAMQIIAPGGVPAFPGFSADFATEELWSSLPGLWVAIVFLFVCGFSAVYLLGPRGFCTYGCPYGGLFRPLEQIAPGRVAVNPDRCDECGECTAACTSNVQVLEETRAFGSVVSSDCIRSLDCVSACPQQALALRFARPAAMKSELSERPPRRPMDATLPEELGLIGVFALVMFTARGLYGFVPLLVAVGVAVSAMFLAWKLWRLARRRDVRLYRFQLKRSGRLTTAGTVYIAGCAVVGILLVQSLLVHWHTMRAHQFDDRVTVPRDLVLAGMFTLVPPEARDDAAEALWHYRRAGSLLGGGAGLASTPANDVRAAWLHLVRGELPEAENALRRAIARQGEHDQLCSELGRLLILQGRIDDALAELEPIAARRPGFVELKSLVERMKQVRR